MSARGGGSMGSAQGFAPGNSAFGRAQAGDPQTGSSNSLFGRNTAAEARGRAEAENDERAVAKNAAKSRKAKATGTQNGTLPARGNSAFGQKQGDASTRTTGSQNNAFGKSRVKGSSASSNRATKKTSGDAEQSTRGNSEFGSRQGDASTRTTGEQNSQFGRNRAEEAKAKGSPSPTPGQ